MEMSYGDQIVKVANEAFQNGASLLHENLSDRNNVKHVVSARICAMRMFMKNNIRREMKHRE